MSFYILCFIFHSPNIVFVCFQDKMEPRECENPDCMKCIGHFPYEVKPSQADYAVFLMFNNRDYLDLLMCASCSLWTDEYETQIHDTASNFLAALELEGIYFTGTVSSIIIAIARAVNKLPSRMCSDDGCSKCKGKDKIFPKIDASHAALCRVLMRNNLHYRLVFRLISCKLSPLHVMSSLDKLMASGLLTEAELEVFLAEDAACARDLESEEQLPPLTIAFNGCLLRDLKTLGASFEGNLSALVIELAIAVSDLEELESTHELEDSELEEPED